MTTEFIITHIVFFVILIFIFSIIFNCFLFKKLLKKAEEEIKKILQ